jgi:putative transcriptional regulator
MEKAIKLTGIFVLALNVSARTVESWEAGKNKPAGSSLKLLYLLETDKNVLKKLVS